MAAYPHHYLIAIGTNGFTKSIANRIIYWYPDEDEEKALISFCEFYKTTTEVKTAAELWNNVPEKGLQ